MNFANFSDSKNATAVSVIIKNDFTGDKDHEMKHLLLEMENDLCNKGFVSAHGIGSEEEMPLLLELGYREDGIQEDFNDPMFYKELQCGTIKERFKEMCS